MEDSELKSLRERTTPKAEYKPANKNAWYVLLTLYGEAPSGGDQTPSVHEKNKKTGTD